MAQELLARQNEGSLSFEIESTTLLNGGLFPGVNKPRLIQNLYKKKNLRKTFIEIFGKDTPPSNEEIDNFWELMNYNNGKAIVHKLIRYMAERVTYEQRWLTALQQSRYKLRLIDGAADPISGLHLVKHYQQVIPNPDCVVLGDIGHYPQVEAPDLVLQSFFNFIQE